MQTQFFSTIETINNKKNAKYPGKIYLLITNIIDGI